MLEAIFDLETKKFFDEIDSSDPAKLGVSIVSLYVRELGEDYREIWGKMYSFWERDFDRMWKHFLEADRVIGFNSLDFDVPAIRPYAPAQFPKLPHFDILSEIKGEFGKKVSLNSLAKSTLGETKVDSGANAIKYFRAGDPASLAKLRYYCEMDVEITKKIYDFALCNKYLRFTDYWNNERQIPVDFSYPDRGESGRQTSLF